MAGIYTVADINKTLWDKKLGAMGKEIRQFGTSMNSQTTKMTSGINQMALALGTVFTFQQGAEFIKKIVVMRGHFQQLEVAFSTLLQSEEKAIILMEEMVDLAIKTPFQLTEVAQGAKQMLAYGLNVSGVVEDLSRLGDVASGLSLPLERMTYLFGTTFTQGRLYARDLLQFTTSGVPMIQGLAEVMDTTAEGVFALVKAGSIGFPQVQEAIYNMTNEGGKFFNLMEKQSLTITGRISNLRDKFELMLNEIGKSQEGLINTTIDAGSYLVEHYEEVGKILAQLVIAYGAYRATLIATIAIEKLHITAIAVKNYVQLARVVGLAATKQDLFNKIASKNPYVWLAAAIAGIAALTLNMKLFNKEQKAQALNTDIIADVNAAVALHTKAQVDAILELQKVVRDENSELKDKAIALEALNKLVPEYTGKLDKEGEVIKNNSIVLDEHIKKLEAAAKASIIDIATQINLDERKKLEDKLIEAKEREVDATERIEAEGLTRVEKIKVEESLKTSMYRRGLVEQEIEHNKKEYRTLDALRATVGNDPNQTGRYVEGSLEELEYLIKLEKERQNQNSTSYKEFLVFENEILRIQKEINAITGEGGGLLGTVGALEKEIKDLEDEQKALATNSDAWEERAVKIIALEDEIEAITGEKRKKREEEELEDLKAKTEEILDRTRSFNKELERLEKEYEEAQAIIKNNAVGESETELEERLAIEKRLYEERIAAAKEAYGIEDGILKGLLSSVENYTRKQLKIRIDALEKDLATNKRVNEDKLALLEMLREVQEDLDQDSVEIWDNVADGLGVAAEAAGIFSSELAQALTLLQGMATGVGKIISGDIFGGAISLLSSVVGLISSTVEETRRIAAEIAEINHNLEVGALNINKIYEDRYDIVQEIGEDELAYLKRQEEELLKIHKLQQENAAENRAELDSSVSSKEFGGVFNDRRKTQEQMDEFIATLRAAGVQDIEYGINFWNKGTVSFTTQGMTVEEIQKLVDAGGVFSEETTNWWNNLTEAEKEAAATSDDIEQNRKDQAEAAKQDLIDIAELTRDLKQIELDRAVAAGDLVKAKKLALEIFDEELAASLALETNAEKRALMEKIGAEERLDLIKELDQDIIDSANNTTDELKAIYDGLADSIRDSLKSALVDAFESGDVAKGADAIKDILNAKLEEIAAETAFAGIFDSLFKEFQAGIDSSFGEGGDKSIIDDILNLQGELPEGIEAFMALLQTFKDEMGLFAPDYEIEGLVGAGLDSLSAEQGNVFIAQNASIMLHSKASSETLTQMFNQGAAGLLVLNQISQYTSNLVQMREDLHSIKINTTQDSF